MKFKITILIAFGFSQLGWGFFAHKKINRLAVFTLPPEIFFFYKENINYLTEKAVNPDMRRYIIKEEAPRHYIDLDVYGDSAVYKLPRYWKEAVEKLTEDTLNAYGVVPWHINRVSYQLSLAFLNKDAKSILRFSADLGHYIADANVPLHTTENYNGQFTGQYGIHGFWESRLPELFFNNYDLLSGKAKYIENTQLAAWHAVAQAHASLDSVLLFEKELTDKFNKSKKYSFEERGATTVKVYSYDFSEEYHERLNGMVERRMLAAIKMVGDFWYTAWVDGGQPDLKPLTRSIETTQDSVDIVAEGIKLRNHESGELVQD
jgi:hypothetical protein